MHTKPYRFDGAVPYTANSISPADKSGLEGKEQGQALLEKNKQEIEELQQRLYAEGRQALLVVLQAMDAAGKDGAVKHVFSGVNPQGVRIADFKQPTREELAHDYLWRIHKAVPARGEIGVFNRSHYEDVLVARVEDLPKKQGLPPLAVKHVWQKRYRHIREFEAYLADNGVRVVKIYLCLSKEEQRQRLLARIADESKNWKFEAGDLATRAQWDAYMRAYREMVNQTAAPHAPWYVVPADHKWCARALISQIVRDELDALKPRYPAVSEKQRADLAMYRTSLEKEVP